MSAAVDGDSALPLVAVDDGEREAHGSMSTPRIPFRALTHGALDITPSESFLIINVRRRTDDLLTDAYVGGVAQAMSVCLIFRFRSRISFAIRYHESTGDFKSATLR